MANLIDELDKFSHSQLCQELAIFDALTMSNMAKTITNKAVSTLFGFTNQLLSVVTESKVNYKGIDNTKKLVDEKKIGYLNYTKAQLMEEYKNRLVMKVGLSNEQKEHLSADLLSVKIIEESASIYRINENLTPYQKADMVHKCYEEDFVKQAHKILASQNATIQNTSNEEIYSAIVRLPVDYRIRLKNTLCVKEFSQAGIGAAIRSVGGKRIISQLIEYVGYEPFGEVDVITRILYDKMGEFNSPDKGILTYFVWRIINLRGKGYSITDDMLPSYVSTADRDREERKNKEFFEVKNAYDNMAKEIKTQKEQLERYKGVYEKNAVLIKGFYGEREKYREKYETLTKESLDVKKHLETAKAELELYEMSRADFDKTAPEYKKLKAEYDDYAKKDKVLDKDLLKLSQNVREHFTKVTKSENEMDELGKNIKDTGEGIRRLESEYEEITKKYNYTIEFELYKLKTKWLTYFADITFEENVINNVVRRFTKGQILNVERAIKEMLDIEDIMAYSNPKYKKQDSDLNYYTFMLSENNRGMIVFTKPTDTGRKVYIADIISDKKE